MDAHLLPDPMMNQLKHYYWPDSGTVNFMQD